MRISAATLLVACLLSLAGSSSARAQPPSGEGGGGQPAQTPSGGGQPAQAEGDCAGGIPGIEQLCDGLSDGLGAVIGPGVDAATGAPAAAAGAVGGSILDQVTKWMTDAARWVTSKIQGLIAETTTPELEAQWYRERFGAMVALGGGLSVLVAMIALGSAALRRDPDALGATFLGMFRAGIGTGIVLALVVLALGVADGITNWVATDASGQAASRFWGDVASAWGAADNAGFGSSAIAFLFAVVQVLAGIAVWIELLLRNAGIYVAVLFMPAALAASIWPPLRAWQSRLVSLLFVLIAMKPVIVVVLSLAGSAAAAGGDADKDLGLVIAAVMILVLAAFVPWVLMMLVSIDSEGAWTARTATGSMKGAVSSGAGRVGGGLGSVATAGGSLAARRPRGGGLGGAGGLGGGGRGGGGRGGGRGGGGRGGGGGGRGPAGVSPGGGRSGGSAPTPVPAGAVAAAAGLVPPGGGARGGAAARMASGRGSSSRPTPRPSGAPGGSVGPTPASGGSRGGPTAPGGPAPTRR